MAVLNSLNQEAAAQELKAWLAGRVEGGDVQVTEVEVPESGGFSMTTVFFHAGWTAAGERVEADLVARVAPAGTGLFEDTDLDRECRVLRAVAEHTAAPVPQVRWFESDPSVLGAPFIVMDRVRGLVPADDPPHTMSGWVVDLATDQRARLYYGALRAMADLHAADWGALDLGLALPEPGQATGAHQLAVLRRAYEWVHGGEPSPTIDAALEILETRVPPDEELVLNWGDARIGNVVFDPQTYEAQALLDWEMATIASPELDLGWFVFFNRYFAEGIGARSLEGFQTRDEIIALYEDLTGRTIKHLDFYEPLAAARTAILLLRIGRMMIEAGAVPADSPMPIANPGSMVLARLLDLPAPDGAVDFMDHRR